MITSIPHIIESELLKYFSRKELQVGLRNLDRSEFQCSFHKGNFPKSFIATGLQLGHPIYNIKVQKKIASKEVSSSCNCLKGKKDQTCEHSVAFLLYYLLNYTDLTEFNTETENQDPDIAHAQFVGKVVKSGNKLVNSNYKHFSQIKYRLNNDEVIDYPDFIEPENLKYIFHLSSPVIIKNHVEPISPILMSYSDESEHSSISIFESKFIFNWDNGKLIKAHPKLSTLFGQIEEMNHFIQPWFITSSLASEAAEYTKLKINSYPVDFDKAIEPKVHFSIQEQSQYSLKVKLSFVIENNHYLPQFLKNVCNGFGVLNNFESKVELKSFLENFFINDEKYKNFLMTLKSKENYEKIFDLLASKDEIYDLEPNDQEYTLIKYNFKLIKEVLAAILNNLDEHTYFSSKFIQEEQALSFHYLKGKDQSVLLDLLKSFKDKDIVLTYLDKKVRTWTSGIKFNRNQSSTNWFDIDIDLTEEDFNLIKNFNPEAQALENDQELVLLNEDEKNYIRFVKKYLKESKKDPNHKFKYNLKFNRCRLFDIYHLYNYSGDDLLTEEELDTCNKLMNVENLPPFDFPEQLNGTPREYQKTGFQWIRLLYDLKLGACLADDMGLGKTFQTISFLQSVIHEIDRVLIVTPVSILANWVQEFEKFSDMKPTLFYGKDRSFSKDDKIIITSYGLMRKEAEELLSQYEWDVFIMDEVQKLKNYKSLGSKASRMINANYRLCLTGTPVENDLSEFYNIVDLAIPGIWGEASQINSFKRSKDARFIARDIAKPFILRRTKKQVLHDLPDKIEQTVYLNFSSEEKDNYKDTLDRIRKEILDNQDNKKYIKVLNNILNLRQLCLWQNTEENFYSSKIDYLVNNLEQILSDNGQVLVYSQFTRYLDLIEKRLNENKWNFSRLDGSYSLKKREAQIKLFKEGKNKIFLISLKAGGLGLNLTEANYIFLMDPWWNPAVESQAVDRAHRIGQEAVLTVYRPIIKDSVEEKVLALQQKKKELFDDLLNPEAVSDFSGKITLEDFQMLLSE